jgi:hypothetical protein
MPKYVGVADIMLLQEEPQLKRGALMFESICLAGMTVLRFLEEYIPDQEVSSLRKIRAMNDWLLEKGVAVPAPPEFGSEALAEELLQTIFSKRAASRLRQEILTNMRGPEGPRIFEAARAGIARRAARRLEADTGWETVVFGSKTEEGRTFEPGSAIRLRR